MHANLPESVRIYRRPGFVVACFAVICLAWAFVVAPFGGPDEPSHFLRSAAMARGQLTGAPQPNKADGILYWETMVDLDPRFDAANAFPVCFRQNPSAPTCGFSFVTPGDENRPATKPVQVDVGLYPPAPYLITAVGTVFGPRMWSLYAARLCNAAACLVLLMFAYQSARRRPGLGEIGLLLILTPAIFFFASTVNPSGLELAGALAAWYLTVELWQQPVRTRRLSIQLAIALSVCALARPLGPLLVGTIIACTVLASKLTVHEAILRLRQRLVATAVVAASVVVSVAWYLAKFSANTGRALAGSVQVSALDQLKQGVGFLPALLRDAVGNFGWLDTPAPFAAWFPWLVALGVVGFFGLRNASSQRLRVGASTALFAAAAVMLSALFQSYTLFHFPALQTRHYLPFALGFFVLVMDKVPALTARGRTYALWAWAAAQIICLGQTARRYLYGLATPSHALAPGLAPWHPPLPIWGVVVLGAAAICGVAFSLQAPALTSTAT